MFYNALGARYTISCAQTVRRRSLVTGERLCTVCGPKYTRSSTTVRPNTAENSSMSAFVVDKSYMFFNASGAPYAISCAQTMRRRSLVTGKRVGTVCELQAVHCNATVGQNAHNPNIHPVIWPIMLRGAGLRPHRSRAIDAETFARDGETFPNPLLT